MQMTFMGWRVIKPEIIVKGDKTNFEELPSLKVYPLMIFKITPCVCKCFHAFINKPNKIVANDSLNFNYFSEI